MRSTHLRRKPPADPVRPEVRQLVMLRDGMCIAAHLDTKHVCRDRWGWPHDPYVLHLLTLEHVKDTLAMGRRAPSDPAHLLAVCWSTNAKPPSKDDRAAFREYLSRVAA